MIGYLRGTVQQRRESSLVLECNGVGYEILIPKSMQHQLSDDVDSVVLHTHQYVRPESQNLYGFLTVAERDMFRILINISSIGPSIALNILSELQISDLVACVKLEDAKPLQKVPRLGKATAAKLLIELSSKMDYFAEVAQSGTTGGTATGSYLDDAREALIVMGFSNRDARSAVVAVHDQAETAEHAIQLALGILGSTGT